MKAPFWAKAVSTVFHPFLMPLFTLATLFFIDPILQEQPALFFYLGFILVVNTLGAAVSLFLMYRRGLIGDLEIRNRRQRLVPFLVVLAYYAMTLLILDSGEGVHTPNVYLGMLRGVVVSIALGVLVTKWYKLSMHAMGAGGLVGAVLATSQFHTQFSVAWLFGWLLVAGLVGSARLALGVHRETEVYLGFIWGCAALFFAILLST